MSFLRNLLTGIKDSAKWILILYAVLLLLELLLAGDVYIVSALSSHPFREVWHLALQPTGGRGAYSLGMAIQLPIPVYCMLFSFWHAFLPEKRHLWTYIFPYAVYMCLCVAYILSELDWNYRISSIDDFMVEAWLAPLFGIVIQSGVLMLKKTWTGYR